MKRATRMLLMNSNKRDNGRDGREYQDEYRFRDRRGREHYDDGRYAPQRNMYGGYPQYMEPYELPYYRGRQIREGERNMNRIGFAVDGEMERIPDEFNHNYHSTVGHPYKDEMTYHSGTRTAGYSESQPHLTREMAMEWAESMENEDGTRGPHWPMEQTKQVQAQKGINCDPIQFWLAMNMIYSDYVKVAKKLGVNSVDFYACMAEAFLDDKDAQPDKLARYFGYVVK